MINIFIDVGGTELKSTYEYNGRIEGVLCQKPSLSAESRDVIINNFCQLVFDVWKQASSRIRIPVVNSVSMAFPGPFDYHQGICKMQGLNKYDSIVDISIPDAMRKRFREWGFHWAADTNFNFLHDVEAYAAGVCKTFNLANRRAIYLCIGTGAGSAYSVNGKIIKEGKGIAENGWFYQYAFKDATIDDYISVRGIEALAQKYLKKRLNPLDLSELARNGNERALAAYREFGSNLHTAMKKIIDEFQADTVVLGGNISKSSDLYADELRKYIKEIDADLIIEHNTSEMIFIGLAAEVQLYSYQI